MADVPNILEEQLQHEHRVLTTILSGEMSTSKISDHLPVAPTRAATFISHQPLRHHATQTTEINPAVMALLKSRLPFQEQAAPSQVQAAQSQVQRVAPTTSSLRAHAASINSCIDTMTDIF